MQRASAEEMNERLASKVMVVNAESNFWTVKEVLPTMLKRNSGQIVTISSLAGLVGAPYVTDYCASKFASYGFSDALRCELYARGKNIKVTTICPYFVNTGMFEGCRTNLMFPLLK